MQSYQIVVLVPGCLLCGWGVWQRMGRSPTAREWATARQKARNDAMFSRPFGGFALIMTALVEPLFRWPVAAVLASVLWIGSAVGALAFGGLLQVPHPRWLEPRWFRVSVTLRRAAESS